MEPLPLDLHQLYVPPQFGRPLLDELLQLLPVFFQFLFGPLAFRDVAEDHGEAAGRGAVGAAPRTNGPVRRLVLEVRRLAGEGHAAEFSIQ